ncbi:hypothetical protein BJ742DRAFT_735695 [Cladochytrium replicatum]|nr:hypothetical protein BJ742DRAFT_735695 [Cladochytrium replicatum]
MQTRSKRQRQQQSQDEPSKASESSRDESPQLQHQRGPLSLSVRNQKANASPTSFAALIAIALMIGSAGYYFQQQQQGSSAGLFRGVRAPTTPKTYAAGDVCDPASLHSVCLYDEGDSYAFCGPEGKLIRIGSPPTGQKCVDNGKGSIALVEIGSPAPSPQESPLAGTTLKFVDCDPGTINHVCLSKTTWGQCLPDGTVKHMGSTAKGTTCSYTFVGGVAQMVQVREDVTNLRDSTANTRIWWQLNMPYSTFHFTLRPGAECGSVGTTLCFGPNNALLCNYSGKMWEPKSCSSCIEQDVTKPFVKDTCNP